MFEPCEKSEDSFKANIHSQVVTTINFAQIMRKNVIYIEFCMK